MAAQPPAPHRVIRGSQHMATAVLETEFAGRRWPLFRLALKTSFLTVLTLGFYRFWMKTRLRRYYWSSIRPGGVPLEYVGEPLEKLLGFLIAVVFLAFYIGIANLILMFLSFSILGGSYAAYVVSFIGVIPILFYAQYRARRYVLARTRWRGIRLGMEPGAWGYAWRALAHWLATILTLGLLWPRMTFWLEKYRADRTYYGTRPTDPGRRLEDAVTVRSCRCWRAWLWERRRRAWGCAGCGGAMAAGRRPALDVLRVGQLPGAMLPPADQFQDGGWHRL